jgi:hypothetical protein
MLVRLANKWFAPPVKSNPTRRPNKIQSMSGRRFPAGKQEISDEYFDYLPKSARVIRGPSGREPEAEELLDAALAKSDPNAELKATDVERAAGDAETKALVEAEDDAGELNAVADAFRAELEAEDEAFLSEVEAEAEENVRHARADEEAALARVEKSVSHDTKPKPAKRGRPAKAKK